MFRLDKTKLGTPCDLCIHNRSNRRGIQLMAPGICKYIKTLRNNRDEDVYESKWVVYNNPCQGFELDIDALETVVYGRSMFSLPGGLMGVISDDGSVQTAVDPMYSVLKSMQHLYELKLVYKYRTKEFKWLMQHLNIEYGKTYCRLTEEDKRLYAATAWTIAVMIAENKPCLFFDIFGYVAETIKLVDYNDRKKRQLIHRIVKEKFIALVSNEKIRSSLYID